MDWRQKALEFIKAKKFTNVAGVDNKRYCHVKFRPEDGSMPRTFGLIFADNIFTIWFLNNENGDLTGDYKTFKSVEEMLDAGWDVD